MSSSKLKNLAKGIFNNNITEELSIKECGQIINNQISDVFLLDSRTSSKFMKKIKQGTNCLILACEFANAQTVVELLDVGAQVGNAPPSRELFATLTGRKDVSEKLVLLLSQNSNIVDFILQEDGKGKTALHLTCSDFHPEIVGILLEYGANPCLKDDEGKSAFHYAWKSKVHKIAKIALLMKYFEKKFYRQPGVETPFHMLANDDDVEILEYLLDHFNLPKIAPNETTPLHVAVVNRSEKCVSLFLQRPSSYVNAQDCEGNTAIHLAAKYCNISMVRLLASDPRTDMTIENFKGDTIGEVAKKHNHGPTSKYVRTMSENKERMLITKLNVCIRHFKTFSENMKETWCEKEKQETRLLEQNLKDLEKEIEEKNESSWESEEELGFAFLRLSDVQTQMLLLQWKCESTTKPSDDQKSSSEEDEADIVSTSKHTQEFTKEQEETAKKETAKVREKDGELKSGKPSELLTSEISASQVSLMPQLNTQRDNTEPTSPLESSRTLQTQRSTTSDASSKASTQYSADIVLPAKRRSKAKKKFSKEVKSRIERITELKIKLCEKTTELENLQLEFEEEKQKIEEERKRFRKRLRDESQAKNQALSDLQKEKDAHSKTKEILRLEQITKKTLIRFVESRTKLLTEKELIETELSGELNKLLQSHSNYELETEPNLEDDFVHDVICLKIYQLVSREMAKHQQKPPKWHFLAKKLLHGYPSKWFKNLISTVENHATNESEAGLEFLKRWEVIVSVASNDLLGELKSALKHIGMPVKLVEEIDALSVVRVPEQEQLTDKKLLELASKIGHDDWKTIGIGLGFNMNELDNIESDTSRAADRNLKMLLEWRNRQPVHHQHTVLGRLLAALIYAQRQDLTHIVDMKCDWI